jgi:hypothetical protein
MLTFRALRVFLGKLSEEQLDQQVQILPHDPDGDKPTHLLPVYAIGAVKELCHIDDGDEIVIETRSADDFKHHPEQIVLESDDSPFDEDGNSSYDLEEDGWRGNKTGKLYD